MTEEQKRAIEAYEYLLKIDSYKRCRKELKPGSPQRRFWNKIIKRMEAQAALIEQGMA